MKHGFSKLKVAAALLSALSLNPARAAVPPVTGFQGGAVRIPDAGIEIGDGADFNAARKVFEDISVALNNGFVKALAEEVDSVYGDEVAKIGGNAPYNVHELIDSLPEKEREALGDLFSRCSGSYEGIDGGEVTGIIAKVASGKKIGSELEDFFSKTETGFHEHSVRCISDENAIDKGTPLGKAIEGYLVNLAKASEAFFSGKVRSAERVNSGRGSGQGASRE